MKRTRRSRLPLIIAAGFVAMSLATSSSSQAEPNGPHALQIRFSPTGATPGASGKAKFRSVRGYSRFTVEAHGLLPGSYDVLIGGGAVGTIDVEAGDAVDAVGRFTLDSRLASGILFDPRGTSVEIVNHQNGATELAAEFPEDKSEERRRIEIDTVLANTGAQPAASGEAAFKLFRGRSKLQLKVAGFAPGSYDVLVGDEERAQLVVTSLEPVELTFDSLPTAEADDAAAESVAQGHARGHGHEGRSLLLTFDPRGLPLSVAQAGVKVLVVEPFPEN